MTMVDIENRIATAPLIGAGRLPVNVPPAIGPTFGDVLQSKVGETLTASAARAGIKFSGHAQTRLASRQITLSDRDVARLGQAMTKAATKGAKDSLLLMD